MDNERLLREELVELHGSRHEVSHGRRVRLVFLEEQLDNVGYRDLLLRDEFVQFDDFTHSDRSPVLLHRDNSASDLDHELVLVDRDGFDRSAEEELLVVDSHDG